MPRQTKRAGPRRSFSLRVGVATLGIAYGVALGCNAVYGIDGLTYEEGTGGTGGGTSTGTATGTVTSTGTATGVGGAGDCAYDTEGCRCFLDDGDCVGLPDLSDWNDVQIYTGSQNGAPTCATIALAYGSTEPGAVTCPACGCSTPSATCASAATFHSADTCNAAQLPVNFDDECTAISTAETWEAVDLIFAIGGGSCSPTGEPSVDDAAFVEACQSPVSCDDGCLPLPDPDFNASFCITHTGDVSCPIGFPVSHKVFASSGFCAPCSCSSPQGAQCRLTLYFNDAVCAGSHTMKGSSVSCSSVGAPPPLSGKMEVTNPGSCQPQGGGEIGPPTVPSHTICCMGES